MTTTTPTNPQSSEPDNLGRLLIQLLKNVLYQSDDPQSWEQLLGLQSAVRDYVSLIGLELILDEAEGYAFLRSKRETQSDEEADSSTPPLPRLITRRQLSFPVSLLLALLRKKLAEFDAAGGETRLVLSREQIVDLIRLFQPDSSNEAKLVDQIERHIDKVVELGFLRRLKSSGGAPQNYEVRRILKAYVDAQWLAEFDTRLDQYRQLIQGEAGES